MTPLIGTSSKQTIRNILKRCMTKKLAQQFSFSGLGIGRTRSKLCFKEHALCVKLLGVYIFRYVLILAYSENAEGIVLVKDFHLH